MIRELRTVSREPNMTCEAFDDLIEPLAAGDLGDTAESRAHLASCARCREAYALAVSIDRLLAAQSAPATSDAFVPAVLARARRERWRSEQQLDLAFNVVIALAVIVGFGGLYALLAVTGLAAVSADLVRLFLGGLRDVTVRAVPDLRPYVLAMAMLAMGLAVWWWAEHGFET
jgi:anti-sigma factor RsiW